MELSQNPEPLLSTLPAYRYGAEAHVYKEATTSWSRRKKYLLIKRKNRVCSIVDVSSSRISCQSS